MAKEQFIDQPFLEKLERLAIHWQKSFVGTVGGHNLSRFSGPGQEFLDHRHFHQGDDLRAVNWRAFMRLEKLFLKMFQVEPRVPVRLLLDVSNSMATGGSGKWEFSRRLAAALCYVGLVRLDSVTIQPFSGKLLDFHQCSGGRHRFSGPASFLERLEPAGASDFATVAREFASRYKQRGMAIIISDFLDDALDPLQRLADFGHELALIQVWASEDREPPWEGDLILSHAETGEHLEVRFDAEARARYTGAFDDYSLSLQRLARRFAGRYVGLDTSMPVEEAIFSPLLRAGMLQ